MQRKIIHIDEEKCTGCGQCIPNCPEGAIQLIDRKARLVSDLFCDGLGACLGHCPEGAITIEHREAEPYDERQVMANIVRQGPNVIRAHLEHLRSHGQKAYLRTALAVLQERGWANPLADEPNPAGHSPGVHGGCPGTRSMKFATPQATSANESGQRPSQLTHWPVQLRLISPNAPQYAGRDVLLSADCVAYALADFHRDWLKDRTLAIACPKLDEDQETYVRKIRMLIDDAKISSLTVLTLEVPCCQGLLQLARDAASQAQRKIPIRHVTVGIGGDIREDHMTT